MFELVDAVETYPRFLPWCDAAHVIHSDGSRTRATIHINYHGLKQSFTTENVKEPPLKLEMLVGPVFSYIANTMVDAFVKRADRLHGG